MQVINRSEGHVTYKNEELKIRRVFTPNESKDIDEAEINALYQMDGGAELLKHYLIVNDKEWVKKMIPDAPVEYFWGLDEIKKCLTEDSVELFSETLDYAPRGVVELIKHLSWKMPLSDMNKIKIINDKLGFDVITAIRVMTSSNPTQTPAKRERLRREEG